MPLLFTNHHVRLRMRQRQVSEAQAQHCVEHGAMRSARGRRIYQLGDLEVVVNPRTNKVVTVLTKDVRLMPSTRGLPYRHYARLGHDLGVHVHYDKDARQHELYGAPEQVARAVRYLEQQLVRTTKP